MWRPGRKRSNEEKPTPSKRGTDRSGTGRAQRSSRSFERPPRGKRERARGLDAQQFDFHGKLADAAVGVVPTGLGGGGNRAGTHARGEAGEGLPAPGLPAGPGEGPPRAG